MGSEMCFARLYLWYSSDLGLVLLWIQNDFVQTKSFWLSPNHFGWVQKVLVGYKSLWSGSNHFGQVQTINISLEKSNLNLTKMIWTRPK